ncbi:hypothetical protein SAMN04488082_1076 [Desulfomicrobium apsheronum]|uniref:Uncharacterized protein n=1 Tax=Desulfomicrobium apsheronum TaxID=52560 RepID=A0A1I3U3K5_9BACT|nr:sel1 repeat family protein [Desulfomicrobium apsheronum]SFJ77512.1 hypothetical protein SAMN04488082_1076 [Desulfomicrobium apsheronum]
MDKTFLILICAFSMVALLMILSKIKKNNTSIKKSYLFDKNKTENYINFKKDSSKKSRKYDISNAKEASKSNDSTFTTSICKEKIIELTDTDILQEDEAKTRDNIYTSKKSINLNIEISKTKDFIKVLTPKFASEFYTMAYGPSPDILPSSITYCHHAKDNNTEDTDFLIRELVTDGLNGSFYALSMAAVIHAVTPDCPQRSRIELIAPWIIRHVGESEGHWLLGVFALHYLASTIQNGRVATASFALEHLSKSSLAGNYKGILFPPYLNAPGADYPLPPTDYSRLLLPSDMDNELRSFWHWCHRAADLGNPWANETIASLLYAKPDPDRPIKEQSRLAVYHLEKAARSGHKLAALTLGGLFHTGKIEEEYNTLLIANRDIHKAFFFYSLFTRLKCGGAYFRHDDVRSNLLAEMHAQKYLSDDPLTGNPPEMTSFEYESILKDTKTVYEEFEAKKFEENAAQEDLYNKARKALPELRAELEAVSVRVGDVL